MSAENTPRGKAKGGVARAKSLSPEDRKRIAQTAAAKRWSTPQLRATHDSADHPLRIGELEIPCYVLEDGRRVLSMGGVIKALGLSRGSAGGQGDRLASFAAGKTINPFINKELMNRIESPILFTAPSGGVAASGYEATILPDICDAVLSARQKGLLQPQQEHIALQCEILVRGFARVGIIALVDEATGFQGERDKQALAKILEAFIAKELQPWVQTFPADFYKELFRLRGLEYPTATVRRPLYFGILTNDIVYKRLAPGVLEELKRVSEKDLAGRPKHKLFQKLTTNVGYPKLREHLGAVVTMMKLSDTYPDFLDKLDRLVPRFNTSYTLPLDYRKDEDDGRGI